ncbi:MAG: hypothetical protein R3348_04020 [Xanthomonadales bacterium]|nr:hypothetical protein [Xanthomonadales bacterium]
MGEKNSLWSELKSRHVVRAAVAHIVFFWLLVQVADVVLPYVGVVDQPVRWAIVAGVALFPVTLIIAWFIEHPWHQYTSSRIAIDLAVILGIGVVTFAWVKNNLPQVIHARTSIVVLPFDYSDEDPMGRTVSRALALEVNSLLMKSKSIDVVGYESASSSELEGMGVGEIIDTLKVEHVLAGAVRAANSSSVDLSLHDASGQEIWSAQLAYDVNDLNALQESIASEVQVRLGETGVGTDVHEVAATRCPMPTDPDALERYYTARHYTESRTDSEIAVRNLREAVDIYQSLIDEYPDFAEAYSGLAWTYVYQATYDPTMRHRYAELKHQLAVKAAERALEHCPNLGEALVHVGNDAGHQNWLINAQQHWELWLDLQPGSTEAAEKLVQTLQQVGRLEDALQLAERNYRFNPLSTQAIKVLMLAYIFDRRFDEAIALQDRIRELGSDVLPWATIVKETHDCGTDVDCTIAALPAHEAHYADQLRIIWSVPEMPEQRSLAIEAAMDLVEISDGGMLNSMVFSSCKYDHLSDLFFPLWDRHVEVNNSGQGRWHWYWPNIWNQDCDDIWQDPRFPALLEEAGLVEYYRAKGWPDVCRPEGDTFECSGAIWREKRGIKAREATD